MKFGKILLKIGGAALKSIQPLGVVSDILGFVNDVLPKDKQLTADATGEQAMEAIARLPENKQAEVLSKKFEVELAEISAHVDVIQALAEVDMTGNSTRPAIARAQSNLIGFGVVITLGPIGYAIVIGDKEMVNAVASIWPLIAAVLGISAGIVNSYFGKRYKEKAQKYEAVTNTSPAVGIISNIIGRFTKK